MNFTQTAQDDRYETYPDAQISQMCQTDEQFSQCSKHEIAIINCPSNCYDDHHQYDRLRSSRLRIQAQNIQLRDDECNAVYRRRKQPSNQTHAKFLVTDCPSDHKHALNQKPKNHQQPQT